MTQGVHQQNWQNNLLVRLLRAKAFENLLQKSEAATNFDVTSPQALRDRKGSFHKYDSEFTFLRLFDRTRLSEYKPVSVIILERNNGDFQIFGVVGDYDSVMEVTVSDTNPVLKFGMFYYQFSVRQENSIQWNTVCESVARIGFGMLLPLLVDNKVGTFALVSSNWEVLSPSTRLHNLLD